MENISYKWSVHPVKENSLFKSILLVVLIIFFVLLIGHAFDVYHAVAALVLLPISMSKYFLPSIYEVSEEGVNHKFFIFSSFKDWNYYSRYCINVEGIFLSPFALKSRLDSFKGLFLKFGREVDREFVTRTVKRHLDS